MYVISLGLKDLEESFVDLIISCLKETKKVKESPLKLFLAQLMINTLEDTPTRSFVRKLAKGEELNDAVNDSKINNNESDENG